MKKKLFSLLFILTAFFVVSGTAFAVTSSLNVTTKTPDSCTGSCGSVTKTVSTTVTLDRTRYNPGDPIVVTTSVNPNWTSTRTGDWTNTNSPGVQACFSAGNCGCASVPVNFGPGYSGFCYQETAAGSPVAGWHTTLQSTAFGSNTVTLTAPQGGTCELLVRLYDSPIFKPGDPNRTMTVPCSFDGPPTTPTITGRDTVFRNEGTSYAIRSTDPNNDRIRYEIDTNNDGVPETSVPSPTTYANSGATQAYIVSGWPTLGNKTFRVRALDTTGKYSAWNSFTVTVENRLPFGTVTGPNQGEPNTAYTFTVTGTDWDSDQVRYEVDSDNNGTIDWYLPSPSTYVNSGTGLTYTKSWTSVGQKYMAIWLVDSVGGRSAPISKVINISSPTGLYIEGPTVGYINQPYTFSFLYYGNESRVRYQIDWSGVGTPGTADTQLPSPTTYADAGAQVTAPNTWTTRGAQTVKVRTVGASGAISTWVNHDIDIINRAPEIPTITPAQANTNTAGRSQDFTITTTDADGDRLFYFIDWGDGSGYIPVNRGAVNSGTVLSVAHSYAASDIYNIKVKATDDYTSPLTSPELIYEYNVGTIPPPTISGPTAVFENFTPPYEYTLTDNSAEQQIRFELDWSDEGSRPWTDIGAIFPPSADFSIPSATTFGDKVIRDYHSFNGPYSGSVLGMLRARVISPSGAVSPWTELRMGVGERAWCPVYITPDPDNDHKIGNPQKFYFTGVNQNLTHYSLVYESQGTAGVEKNIGNYPANSRISWADGTVSGYGGAPWYGDIGENWVLGTPVQFRHPGGGLVFTHTFRTEYVPAPGYNNAMPITYPSGFTDNRDGTYYPPGTYQIADIGFGHSLTRGVGAGYGVPQPPAGGSCSATCRYVLTPDGTNIPATQCSVDPNPEVRVNPLGLSCSVLSPAVNPEPFAPGNVITWQALATGGTGPYTYTWTGATANPSNPSRATNTPPSEGTYVANVSVQDASGTRYPATGTITCPEVVEQGTTGGLTVSVAASKQGENNFSTSGVTVRVGQSADIRTNVISGNGLSCQSSGNGFDREPVSVRNPASGFGGIPRTFTSQEYNAPGQYTYRLTCTDDDTASPAASSVTVTVIPVPIFIER